MILTWFRLWPFLFIPLMVLIPILLIPEIYILNQKMGGIYVSDFLVNLILPFMQNDHALALIDYYKSGGIFSAFVVSMLIAININVLLLPLLYGLGNVIILVSSWFTTTELIVKTKIARR